MTLSDFRQARLPALVALLAAAIAVGNVRAALSGPADGDEIKRFCSNIADPARDQRYALQEEKLKALQKGVDERIQKLEAKRAEYEQWLKRRDDFLAKAKAGLVQIYAEMKPDGAAERLAVLQPDLAAAILMKLDPRKAGEVLNNMDPKAAAKLTAIIADSARKIDPS